MLLKSKIRIAVAPAAAYDTHRHLFDMLSCGLGAAFEPHIPGQYSGLDGLIALANGSAAMNGAMQQGLSCYQVTDENPIASSESSIKFNSSGFVHRAFRNKHFIDPSIDKFSSVAPSSGCLAQINNHPVWTVERVGNQSCHRVGIALPSVNADDFFSLHFRSTRWFAMVPLLHFLRELLGPDGWPMPEPRASFIIDDPNLHHSGYGFIDFNRLVKHAAVHKYHTTIATVPLDAWYFDRKAAALFRDNTKLISLMMHGVNHIADELARPYNEEQSVQLLAAGLRRIAAFEARSGLNVARVMAAPHGAFAESMADPMVRLGFESACISVGSLVRWNPQKHWPKDFGLSFAQSFGNQGFPVFHRSGVNVVDISLIAFLGHPVVIATHHQDCVSNFARFESLANMVNEITTVRWATIEEISRTNYISRVEGNVLRVRPYSRRLTVSAPETIAAVEVESSAFGPAMTIDVQKHRTEASQGLHMDGEMRWNITQNVIQIFFPATDSIDYRNISTMAPGLWPVVRRFLAEGRDRLKPMLAFGAAR